MKHAVGPDRGSSKENGVKTYDYFKNCLARKPSVRLNQVAPKATRWSAESRVQERGVQGRSVGGSAKYVVPIVVSDYAIRTTEGLAGYSRRRANNSQRLSRETSCLQTYCISAGMCDSMYPYIQHHVAMPLNRNGTVNTTKTLSPRTRNCWLVHHMSSTPSNICQSSKNGSSLT